MMSIEEKQRQRVNERAKQAQAEENKRKAAEAKAAADKAAADKAAADEAAAEAEINRQIDEQAENYFLNIKQEVANRKTTFSIAYDNALYEITIFESQLENDTSLTPEEQKQAELSIRGINKLLEKLSPAAKAEEDAQAELETALYNHTDENDVSNIETYSNNQTLTGEQVIALDNHTDENAVSNFATSSNNQTLTGEQVNPIDTEF